MDIPHYYRIDEVTLKPRVQQDIRSYAALPLPDDGVQRLTLRLFVNETGRIDKVLVVNSELSPEYESRVTTYFNSVRFAPGEIDGLPVKVHFDIEVKLESTR